LSDPVVRRACASLPRQAHRYRRSHPYATGRGQNKEQGRRIKYKRTPQTERPERDVKELNAFLARVKLTGLFKQTSIWFSYSFGSRGEISVANFNSGDGTRNGPVLVADFI